MITLLEAAALAEKTVQKAEALAEHPQRFEQVMQQLWTWGISAGKNIIVAVIVFLVGRFIISMLNKLVAGMLERRHVEATIQSFLKSFVNILLTLLLIVSVVSALGVNTTSFAALLASAGVAIGMALSGNLQNLAGGLIILLFKPYKVGDWVEAQGTSGTVKEIQIFHTLLTTGDNKVVYIPNGAMSSGIITNFSRNESRRVEWIIGVEYGDNIDHIKATVEEVIESDTRILKDPAPKIVLYSLSASSVDISIRAWTSTADYWDVYFDMNRRIYDEFNKRGIDFPYPQLTVHQA